jgi:hypothetical protein
MPPAASAAPATTVFGRALSLPQGFEDASTYCFYLDSVPNRQGIPFTPNMVVTREKARGSLQSYVQEERKRLLEKAPKLAVLKEGAYKVAGQPAHQAELAVALPEPRLELVQWQVATIRDGQAYCFFATTTRDRWAADRPRFEAFVDGWK